MRDPARKEQGRRGVLQIDGIDFERSVVEIITYMVQRHDHHDQAAQEVDSIEPRPGLGLHGRLDQDAFLHENSISCRNGTGAAASRKSNREIAIFKKKI